MEVALLGRMVTFIYFTTCATFTRLQLLMFTYWHTHIFFWLSAHITYFDLVSHIRFALYSFD